MVGLPELLGIHFAEAFVALDVHAVVAAPVFQDALAILVGVRVDLFLALLELVERRLRDVDVAGLDQALHVR
jgi:hypothetical protein